MGVLDYMLAAGVNAGSNIASAYMASKTADKWNRKQYEQTEKWNQINLDYAKNAQTYATADRLRAGLSPLDVQPQAAPSSNIASSQLPDLSGVGQAGSAIQSGLQAAMKYKLDKESVDAQVELNNALKTKANNESAKTQAETLSLIGQYKTELELKRAELERLKNVNSTYKQEVEAKIAESYKRIADLESQISQRDTLTPSLVSMNESTAGRNNAEAKALQSDLTFANAFNIPYSMLKSLNFNSPFASAASDAFLLALKNKQNAQEHADDMVSYQEAYRQYVNSYDAAMSALEEEYNRYFASGFVDNGLERDFKDRRKVLGKKMSFSEFVKRAKR